MQTDWNTTKCGRVEMPVQVSGERQEGVRHGAQQANSTLWKTSEYLAPFRVLLSDTEGCRHLRAGWGFKII